MINLSPERREDFYRRLSERYSAKTGLPAERCREIAEEVNRGGPHEHRSALFVVGLGMLADALAGRSEENA